MKSFSEYLKESYGFRLGGSQKRGFNQQPLTFKDLKRGDEVYHFDNSDGNKIYVYKFDEIGYDKTYIHVIPDFDICCDPDELNTPFIDDLFRGGNCTSTDLEYLYSMLNNEDYIDIENIEIVNENP